MKEISARGLIDTGHPKANATVGGRHADNESFMNGGAISRAA